MNEVLTTELQIYLGELLQTYKTTYEHFEKRIIAEKINAIETILEIPKTNF